MSLLLAERCPVVVQLVDESGRAVRRAGIDVLLFDGEFTVATDDAGRADVTEVVSLNDGLFHGEMSFALRGAGIVEFESWFEFDVAVVDARGLPVAGVERDATGVAAGTTFQTSAGASRYV